MESAFKEKNSDISIIIIK